MEQWLERADTTEWAHEGLVQELRCLLPKARGHENNVFPAFKGTQVSPRGSGPGHSATAVTLPRTQGWEGKAAPGNGFLSPQNNFTPNPHGDGLLQTPLLLTQPACRDAFSKYWTLEGFCASCSTTTAS